MRVARSRFGGISMRKLNLTIISILCGALASCGNYSLPSPEQQQQARAAIAPLLTGVAQSRRDGDAVIAIRWDVQDVSLQGDEWSWTEIEVIARSDAEGAEAVTTRWSISLDPAALGSNVPASISRQAWGMTLICEETDCVRRRGVRTTVLDGERTEETLGPEQTDRAEWLFEEFETRDRVTELVKEALGLPPR